MPVSGIAGVNLFGHNSAHNYASFYKGPSLFNAIHDCSCVGAATEDLAGDPRLIFSVLAPCMTIPGRGGVVIVLYGVVALCCADCDI